jgi:hypothetical protein
MSRDKTVVAEPFSERESIEISVGDDGKTHTVSVGGRYENVTPRYVNERVPAEVVRIYMDPHGLPGGRFSRSDGHVCTPTVVLEYDVPEDHEYAHLDGETYRIENYNCDYVLGLRIPDWEQ